MSKSTRELSLILSAKDRMSKILTGATKTSEKQFERLKNQIKGVSDTLDSIGKKSMIAGGALLATAGLNLKAAADFEKSMSNVSTLIDTNSESMKEMNKEVLAIAGRTPVAISDLTSGLYDIRSAGISASDAMNDLEGSARLGVAGLASTAETVDVVTSAINAFNLKGEEQTKLYDTLFKVVKYGKTNLSEFAVGFGSVAGIVASSGVEVDEYCASVAAMTTTGLKANNAHTQMSAALASLTRGSKEQVKIFNSLGAKSFKDLVAKSGGMVNAFKRIDKAVGGDEAKMVSLMGSINGYKAVLGLTNTVNKQYSETLNEMRYGASAVDEAFQKQSSTMDAHMQVLKNSFESLRIQMGEDLALAFGKIVSGVQNIVNAFESMPEGLRKFISIGSVTAGIGLTLFGGISLGASAAMKSVVQFGETMQALKKTKMIGVLLRGIAGGFKSIGLAIAGTPVGWIIAGIAALAVVGVLIYKYWKPIKALFVGIAEGLKASLKPAFDAVKEALKPLQPVFDKIKSALKGAWEWFKNLIKPVDDVGGKSHDLGVKIGKLIGGFITFGIKLAGFMLKMNPLVLWLTLVWKNFDKIRDVIGKVSEKLKGFFSKFGGKSVKASVSVSDNTKEKVINGKHASGLDYVPFDGYIAELHKGEAVLTSAQNKERRKLNQKHSMSSLIQITYSPVINTQGKNEIRDIEQILDRNVNKLIAKIEEKQRRAMIRAYA